MLFSLEIELDLKDSKVVYEALKPDDVDWAKATYREGRLVIRIETNKIGAVINAFEDFMMNVKAAVSSLESLSSALQREK